MSKQREDTAILLPPRTGQCAQKAQATLCADMVESHKSYDNQKPQGSS